MGTEKKMKPIPVHSIYAAKGGKSVCGDFRLNTPELLEIQECRIVSADGLHRAVFSPTAKKMQKDCEIRITSGEFKGHSGNLDRTARSITSDPKKSGWNYWRIVDPPQWYLDFLTEKWEKWIVEKETAAKPSAAKPSAAKPSVKRTIAEMGGLES